MDLDIKRWRQALTVARCGSFSQAAEELHITQPALSRSIATLEERYGIRLFDRSHTGVAVTAVGRQVLQQAETLLQSARAMEHNLHLFGRGSAGRVTFGMGPMIAALLLPGLSRKLLQTQPNVLLQAITKSATLLYEELLEESIELFFCAEGQLQGLPAISCQTVGHLDTALLVRAAHPLADLGEVSYDDIAPFPALSGTEISRVMDRPGAGGFICDNYHILRDLTLDSDAVWASSPQLVPEEISDGRLKALRLTDSPLQSNVPVGVVTRAGSSLSPAAQHLVDEVRELLATINPIKR